MAIALLLCFIFVTGWFWGAGYEPTSRRVRRELLDLLEERFRPDQRFVFYDLGSGFGGVLMDVAERFSSSYCTGIESDWLKCAVANRRARKRGFGARVIIIRGNLLKLHFTEADVVYMFLSPFILKRKEIMDRIGGLKPNSLIVSYCHKIPFLRPTCVIGKDVFLYVWGSQ